MLAELLQGVRYLLTGCRLLARPGLRRYVAVPLLISAAIFSLGIYVAGQKMGAVIDGMIPAWLDWARYLLWPLFAAAALVILYFGFVITASVVAAPFNGTLARAVEHDLTGTAQEPAFDWRDLPKEFALTTIAELRKIGYFLMLALPCLLAQFVPLIGQLLWFIYGAWVLACNYADYPMGNHGLRFPEQRRLLRRCPGLTLGFGIGVLGMTLIPIVNFFAMPAAVAGATALYLERLRARDGTASG
jgi:CysZ protein